MLRRYVIPLLVMIGILVAWDFTKPRYSDFYEPSLPAPQRPNGGVPPWNPNEVYRQQGRDQARAAATRALGQAWSDFCRPKGHKKLVDALNYYFGQRRQQEQSYPARWGEEGRDYITREWATSDDRRIERVVRETYERGYIDLGDLNRYVAARIRPLVDDAVVRGHPCRT